MHNNPYKILPGEKLSPQDLLDRFLDWNEYRKEVRAYARANTCDEFLFTSHLCCQDHFNYHHEHQDFLRYFIHLDMLVRADANLTNELLRGFIIRNGLRYDIERLAKNMNMTTDQCSKLMLLSW